MHFAPHALLALAGCGRLPGCHDNRCGKDAEKMAVSSSRDPYPFPRLQNDKDFVSRSQDEAAAATQADAGADSDPWTRLNASGTLSSLRREAYHYDPRAPNNSLDFVLKCQYDHHQEFMKSKAETLLQPETKGVPHGRVLKNRPVMQEPVTLETKELVTYIDPKKTLIHSSKGLAIESHHSEATNRGYSRKRDGGFYST